jgi:hypothetical protein
MELSFSIEFIFFNVYVTSPDHSLIAACDMLGCTQLIGLCQTSHSNKLSPRGAIEMTLLGERVAWNLNNIEAIWLIGRQFGTKFSSLERSFVTDTGCSQPSDVSLMQRIWKGMELSCRSGKNVCGTPRKKRFCFLCARAHVSQRTAVRV